MNEFEYDFFYKLRHQNVLTIASAGNSGDDRLYYPAAYPHVMSVSALDQNKTVTEWSTQNQHVDISAPGAEILSTMPMGFFPAYLCYQYGLPYKYSYLDGTSMAAPHVSGVAALLWSAEPNATAKEIQDAIQKSAEDLGLKGKDPSYGHGLVAALDALNRLKRTMEGDNMGSKEATGGSKKNRK
jgi:subtilisin family serine protease